jgi:hypothetical protein
MKTIALPSMLGLLFCLHATPALAIPETWVASNGGGVACTRAAPCASFQTAHLATDPGGIIKCVDAGNFGAVGITKSITIDCTGTNGGIVSVPGGPGVELSAAGIDVTLRGLSIDGSGFGGFIGVRMANGNRLNIEDCRISSFVTGVLIQPTGSVAVRVALTRVQVGRNTNTGIVANGTPSTGSIVVQVRDSVVANNGEHGITALTIPGGAFTGVVVDRSSIILNFVDGIRADGAGAVVHLGNSTVIGNAGGLIVANGGQILSYQNNQASGNGVDGAPTGVLTVK